VALVSSGEPRPIRVGLLGLGNVGAALVELIGAQREAIRDRTGLDLVVTRVAVRSAAKARAVEVDPALLTTDASEVVTDPDIDIVVELIGGIEPARELTLAALNAGKPVVTGNKELVANHAVELFTAAEANGVDLLFEAAVAGAIPIMRPLRESLIGEPIARVMGIVNGTTNYILSAMSEDGASYADALAEAQSRGFAERDPTADVEGFDAAAKAAIIATIAFGQSVVAGDVYREGISSITASDIAAAERFDMVVKLLAITESTPDDSGETRINARVHPAMVPSDHPLASVRGSFNAVFIEGEALDDLMLYGRGAGGTPTASAVLGDLIDAAGNASRNTAAVFGTMERARLSSIDDVRSAFYLTLDLIDQAGVLAAVAEIFGRHQVSIRSMEQAAPASPDGGAHVVFITHATAESGLTAVLDELGRSEVVASVGTVMRVIGVD